MKHIKSYKIFESDKSSKGVDIEILRDICYDITDDGKFQVDFNTDHKTINRITISCVRKYTCFKISEISDVFLRLIEYIGDDYIRCGFVNDERNRGVLNIKYLERDSKYYDIVDGIKYVEIFYLK